MGAAAEGFAPLATLRALESGLDGSTDRDELARFLDEQVRARFAVEFEAFSNIARLHMEPIRLLREIRRDLQEEEEV